MRLFLDANIFFSAAHSENSHAYLLVRFAEAGHCVILGSPHAIGEATRNDLLVTGDVRYFGPLFGKTLRGVHVATLGDAVELVLKSAIS